MNAVLTGLLVGVVVIAVALVAVFAGRWLRRRMLDPPGVRAAAQALRTAGLAAPPQRVGPAVPVGAAGDPGGCAGRAGRAGARRALPGGAPRG